MTDATTSRRVRTSSVHDVRWDLASPPVAGGDTRLSARSASGPRPLTHPRFQDLPDRFFFASIGAGLVLDGRPVVDVRAYAAAVFMVVVTTMATPPRLL